MVGPRPVDPGPRPDPDTRTVNPDAGGPPLFCVPPFFGEVAPLLGLGRALPGVRLEVLRPPGMDWEAHGLRDLEAMAAHLADRIERLAPAGELHLFGACFGGILAFGAARALETRGRTVANLVLADTKAPSPGASIREDVAYLPLGQLRLHPHLAEGMKLAETYRKAFPGYRPEPLLRASIDLLYATAEGRPVDRDRRLGWAPLAGGRLRIHPLPGDHVDILVRLVGPVAELLRDRLGRREVPGLTREGLADYLPDYRILEGPDGASALSCRGRPEYRVLPARSRGHLDRVALRAGRLFVDGWAMHPAGPAAAEEVLLFFGDRLAGRARRGIPRPDVAAGHGLPDLGACGFACEIELGPEDRPGRPRLRAFTVADGAAAELEDGTGSEWTRAPSLAGRLRDAWVRRRHGPAGPTTALGAARRLLALLKP